MRGTGRTLPTVYQDSRPAHHTGARRLGLANRAFLKYHTMLVKKSYAPKVHNFDLYARSHHNKIMAELTDRDIRMIQDIHLAVTNMGPAMTDIRNMVRDIRSATGNSGQTNSVLTVVNDVRNSVNTIKTHAAHLNEVMTNLITANSNFAALQQFLMRIESNTQGANGVINHIEQIRSDVASLQKVLSNLEQFMNDVSVYVQDMQSRLTDLHANQQQLLQDKLS